ncbi:MAG: PHP domain-containing protein [Thermoanaerobaculia bacterium]
MRFFKGDLHIHTCLSPCADLEMSPKNIIEEAKLKGLEILAICDHNSMENTEPAMELGKENNILVLPGMEVTTEEEVHILGIFENLEKALPFQNIIYENLPDLQEERFLEEQPVVDREENVLSFCKKSLFYAVNLKIEEIVEKIHQFGGLAIASHIDREAFSIIGQLGFIPEGLKLDGLEVVFDLKKEYEFYNLPLIRSSDSHFLEEIGQRKTEFYLGSLNFEEITLAFKNKEGRFLKI